PRAWVTKWSSSRSASAARSALTAAAASRSAVASAAVAWRWTWATSWSKPVDDSAAMRQHYVVDVVFLSEPSRLEGSYAGLAGGVRDHAGRLATALMHVTDDFATAEDLVQDAVLAALQHWPAEGIPQRPDA